jgi:serine protease Do
MLSSIARRWPQRAKAVGRTAALAALALCLSHPLAAQQGTPPVRGAGPQLDVNALSVVKVRTQAHADARTLPSLGREREGSGVVIDATGLVLTIGYLILEAETVELATSDGRAYRASVVGYDSATGFGLVRAREPLPVKPLRFGVSADLADRELVLVVGFDGAAPAYVVSRRPFVGYWEYMLDEAIYTAPATVNWSGAALLNRDGKLLGIGSLVVNDALGTRSQIPGNLFVPIDLLTPLLGDLIATGKSGNRPRPWMGINSQERQGTLVVTRVSPGGPAAEARIAPGDVIAGIDGELITGQADFYQRLWSRGEAGVEIVLEVLRGGRVDPVVVKTRDRETYFWRSPGE